MRSLRKVVTLSTLRITSLPYFTVLLPHFYFLFRSQDETSEEFLGEWMESRKNRDQIVLATKVRALALDGSSFTFSNMRIR